MGKGAVEGERGDGVAMGSCGLPTARVPDQLTGKESGTSSGVHDVVAGLAQIRAGVERVLAARAWSLGDGQVADAVVEAGALLAGLEAARLGLVAELDTRPATVPGASAGAVAATFLIHRTRLSPVAAHRDVRAAGLLDRETGDLRLVGAALAEGAISAAHAHICAGVAAALPRRLLQRVDPETGQSGMAAADAFLARHARRHDASTMRDLGRRLLAVLDPDGTDRFDPDACRRRYLRQSLDGTGMLVGRFAMDAADAALFTAVIAALAAPRPMGTAQDGDGRPVQLRDERTKPQRDLDALVLIARHAASCADAPRVPAPRRSPGGGEGSCAAPGDARAGGSLDGGALDCGPGGGARNGGPGDDGALDGETRRPA